MVVNKIHASRISSIVLQHCLCEQFLILFPSCYFQLIQPQIVLKFLVIYQFMSCWNEFNLALIMLTKNQIKTLPLGLVNFWTAYQAQWGQVGAAMIMASVPVLVIYLFFSNQITDAMSTSGMKN